VTIDLIAAAERVSVAVDGTDTDPSVPVRVTQAQLRSLPRYDGTLPTSPPDGFRYLRSGLWGAAPSFDKTGWYDRIAIVRRDGPHATTYYHPIVVVGA
jgi:hypothetical protein